MDTILDNLILDQSNVLRTIIKQKEELGTFVKRIESNPALIRVLLHIMNEDKGTAKFYCDKVIRNISESHPSIVYPYFNEIALLLSSKNNFIKWGFIQTISNLIYVDKGTLFNAIYDHYFLMINSDSMITASNVIGNAWKFAQAIQEKENDITSRLLKVIENTYLYKGEESPECKNIVIGHVLDCFSKYYFTSNNQDKMIEFAHNQINNSRKSTAIKEVKFIKRYAKTE